MNSSISFQDRAELGLAQLSKQKPVTLKMAKKSSGSTEKSRQIKTQEAKKLEDYAKKYNLWIDSIDFLQYVSKVAGQRVFLNDSDHVIK